MNLDIDMPRFDASAICTQVDPETWFPPKGGDPRPAKLLCQGCPWLAECLQYALARPELHGVWGGTSERDRNRIRRERNMPTGPGRGHRPRPRCGTAAGYKAHLRRNEPDCPACRMAANAATQLHKERHAAQEREARQRRTA